MESTKPSAEALLAEELIPVQDLPSRLPPSKSGRPMNRAAVWRWVSRGLSRPDGSRVRLEALLMGRRWVTSKEALARFFVRLSGGRSAGDQSPAPPAASRTVQALKPATLATLARHGISVPNSAASS